jgi:hypothetical protein
VELQGPLLALLACRDGLALVTSHPLVSGSTWWDDTAR